MEGIIKPLLIASSIGAVALAGILNIECSQDYNSVKLQLEEIGRRDPVQASGLAINTKKEYAGWENFVTLYNAPRACQETLAVHPELRKEGERWAKEHPNDFVSDPRAVRAHF